MTFKHLRNSIDRKGKVPILWKKSGIVELAEVTETGAVRITNVVTRHHYTLPRFYEDLDISILHENELIELGKLLPKGYK